MVHRPVAPNVPGVFLPWAIPQYVHSQALPQPATSTVIESSRLKVSEAHGSQLPHHNDGDQSHRRRTQRPQLPLALQALDLPYSPSPAIPDEDRGLVSPDSLLSVAVVLDVMATKARRLTESSTILAELAEILIGLGEVSGIGPTEYQEILADLTSPDGDHREELSRKLAACLQGIPLDTTDESSVQPSTPDSVQTGIQFLGILANHAIAEATLTIDNQAIIEYHQA